MVKLVAFFKRRPGMTVDAFQQHWRSAHAELVVRQKGLRRYVQNHTLASGYAKREADYDGVAEAWFDSVDDMRALADSSMLGPTRRSSSAPRHRYRLTG